MLALGERSLIGGDLPEPCVSSLLPLQPLPPYEMSILFRPASAECYLCDLTQVSMVVAGDWAVCIRERTGRPLSDGPGSPRSIA